MEPDVIPMAYVFKFWPWFEANFKRIAWSAGIVVLVAVLIAFYVWKQNQAETTAGMALTRVIITPPGNEDPSASFLKVATNYPGTTAGARALLEGAAILFSTGHFVDAQTQFQRFVDTYPDNPFRAEASLGIAACLDAQGRMDAALTAYNNVASQSPDDNVLSETKFALAHIYSSQGKWAAARSLFEDVAHSNPYNSLGQEAFIRAQEMTLAAPAAPAVSPKPAKFLLSSTNLVNPN